MYYLEFKSFIRGGAGLLFMLSCTETCSLNMVDSSDDIMMEWIGKAFCKKKDKELQEKDKLVVELQKRI